MSLMLVTSFFIFHVYSWYWVMSYVTFHGLIVFTFKFIDTLTWSCFALEQNGVGIIRVKINIIALFSVYCVFSS